MKQMRSFTHGQRWIELSLISQLSLTKYIIAAIWLHTHTHTHQTPNNTPFLLSLKVNETFRKTEDFRLNSKSDHCDNAKLQSFHVDESQLWNVSIGFEHYSKVIDPKNNKSSSYLSSDKPSQDPKFYALMEHGLEAFC